METSDDINELSSPESELFDETVLSPPPSNITTGLSSAGSVGLATAVTVAPVKKRKNEHSFELNPTVRKRQQTRLIRKLKATLDEFTVKVGQQAVVLTVTPGKPDNNFKVFGAQPLQNVMRKCKNEIIEELEEKLFQQAPVQSQENSMLYDLPPLVIDGIPTPVEKMTQAQLRAFIPLMLKYSTGRGKPGWGRESSKPVWWPKELPWANVRSDVRTEKDKKKLPWTHALRQIVVNCYKYHGREDLLPVLNDEGKSNLEVTDIQSVLSSVHSTLSEQASSASYTPLILQAVNFPDGTVSLFSFDPANTVVAFPNGSLEDIKNSEEIKVLCSQDEGKKKKNSDNSNDSTASDSSTKPADDDETQPQSSVVIPVSLYQAIVDHLTQSPAEQVSVKT